MEGGTALEQQRTPLRVGCALLPKKVERYLTTEVKQIAASKGIELFVLDPKRPIGEQGHFDAIVHKLRPSPEWENLLLDYVREHPGVKVIDRLDSIRNLQNRGTMLNSLCGEGILVKQPATGNSGSASPPCSARVQAPPQVLVPEGTSLQEAQRLLDAQGLAPPLLVKPLWTDGREGSHGLAVLHDFASLGRLLAGTVSSDLQPPLVVQQYVEHGGIIFKIYVLGGTTVVTKRPSIVSDQHLAADNRCKGLTQLPRISCAARAAASTEDLQKLVVPVEASGQGGMPPGWVTDALAASLRKRLGLQLFNFDMICPEQQPQQQQGLYYVVDINYFPGVDKLPGFEAMFVDFLISACEGRTAPPPASPRAGQCAPAASPFS